MMPRTRATLAAAVLVPVVAVAGGASAYAALQESAPRARTHSAPDLTAGPTGDRPARTAPAQAKPKPGKPAEPAARPTKQPRPVKAETPVAEPDDVVPDRLWGPGDRGADVRELQARLRQIDWFSGNVTDFYGDLTRAAVAGFQTKRGFPSTGVVDQRTLDRLEEMTSEPTADELANVVPAPVTDPADGAALDPRCQVGHVICIDKTSSSLRWVVDGDVRLTVDARFGGNGHFTREGAFEIQRKSRDHVSSLYHTSMPLAMFFSGGEAVHYSPDFAANGYNGSSHGCVNIRDYAEMSWLFDQAQVGDDVVVYWS